MISEFANPKIPRALQIVHLRKMLALNSQTYFLYNSLSKPSLIQNILLKSKFFSQGSIEQDHLLKNVKKFGSNKEINFSTESVEKQTPNDLLFIIAIYSLQNVNYHQNSLFTISTVFVGLGSIFVVGLPLSFSENYFWY